MSRYDVSVRLTGKDGNAFFIIGEICRKLRGHGVDREEIKKFQDEAMAGDYDHLLSTCGSR